MNILNHVTMNLKGAVEIIIEEEMIS